METFLTISFINAVGQSGLPRTKQCQIESFLKRENIDILNIQEIDVCDESFSMCPLISSSYNILSNNSPTRYGTAVILKSDLNPQNVQFDSNGRVIIFEIDNLTLGNVYLPSGTDAAARSDREKYVADTLPQLLLNRRDNGVLGGDFNCIINKLDATHHQSAKMSPNLAKMMKTFDIIGCFRSLHPSGQVFSHFYHTT